VSQERIAAATVATAAALTSLPARQATSSGADTVVLVGNPNVGKSALFGALTGKYVTVSNYPGTTVEVTRGAAWIAGRRRRVLDTPGASGLTPMSEDESAAAPSDG
jgi:ferrous iron transport protein B